MECPDKGCKKLSLKTTKANLLNIQDLFIIMCCPDDNHKLCFGIDIKNASPCCTLHAYLAVVIAESHK